MTPEFAGIPCPTDVWDMRDNLEDRCPHGDPTCPCQDGDPCHYEWSGGSPPMDSPGQTENP